MWGELVQAMFKRRTTAQRRKLMAVTLALAVMVAPVRTLAAQTEPAQASDGKSGAAQAPATHATRGIVRTIDASTMVITRGNRGIMTFSLTSSTHREGVVVVGSTVSVRYREDGKNHVATAIALQRPKE
jgi:Cu/Ag efflux protein CusF